MSHYDDKPTFPGFTVPLAPGSWDGTTEALAMGVVMEPPEGFLARAVARGLAVVEAEEALVAYREQRSPRQRPLREHQSQTKGVRDDRRRPGRRGARHPCAPRLDRARDSGTTPGFF